MNELDAVRLNFSPESLIALNVILAFVMFGVALDMRFSDFKGVTSAPRAVVIALLCQFFLLPATAWAMGMLLEPQPSIALGLILVASCPGGNISNFMGNLAQLYESQGRQEEAEALYLKTLEFKRRVLGEQHPDTLVSMSDLAGLYNVQGRYGEAEPLYLKTLKLRRQVLGVEHPSTLTSMNNLALLYKAQGRYEQALPLFVSAVNGARASLPKGQWQTGAFLGPYGRCLAELGRYDEAEAAGLEAYEILRGTLGEEHERTREAAKALVDLYHAWGKPDQAAKWRAVNERGDSP